MPFADDVNLSQLPALAGNLLLVDVFTNPQRFRFNHLGDELIHRLGANVTSKFADEVELTVPSNFSSRKRAPRSKRGRRPATPAGAGTRTSCFRPGATAASSCYSAQSRSRQQGGGALCSIARKYSAGVWHRPNLNWGDLAALALTVAVILAVGSGARQILHGGSSLPACRK